MNLKKQNHISTFKGFIMEGKIHHYNVLINGDFCVCTVISLRDLILCLF